jgi:hypothetical protein
MEKASFRVATVFLLALVKRPFLELALLKCLVLPFSPLEKIF